MNTSYTRAFEVLCYKFNVVIDAKGRPGANCVVALAAPGPATWLVCSEGPRRSGLAPGARGRVFPFADAGPESLELFQDSQGLLGPLGQTTFLGPIFKLSINPTRQCIMTLC